MMMYKKKQIKIWPVAVCDIWHWQQYSWFTITLVTAIYTSCILTEKSACDMHIIYKPNGSGAYLTQMKMSLSGSLTVIDICPHCVHDQSMASIDKSSQSTFKVPPSH